MVVEDERLPRAELRAMLEAEGVDVVGEADSVATGLHVIKQLEPELVLLDIQLGRETAFDLLDRLDVDCDIIFVTAYDHHAVKAFELNAIDYLLKPVEQDRLREALGRLAAPDKDESSEDPQAAAVPAPYLAGDRLFVKASDRWRFLRVDEISVVEAAGDYTRLRLMDGGEVLLSRPVKEWEERLPGDRFVRIHRSTIVNLDHVTKVDEWFNHTFQVHVKGIERPYSMSRRYAARLKR